MKDNSGLNNIALLTIESAVSHKAITRFIESHHQQIVVVIESDRFDSTKGSNLQQFLQHNRRSGLLFTLYLTYCFFVYPLFLKLLLFKVRLFQEGSSLVPLKELCSRYNIQYIKSADVNGEAFIEQCSRIDIDLIVSIFFDQILKESLISIPKKGCVNVHPGLLPECRGLFPEIHAATGKCCEHGITIHRIVDSNIDSGEILYKTISYIDSENDILEVGRDLLERGVSILSKLLDGWYKWSEISQLSSDVNYYSYPDRNDIKVLEKNGRSLLRLRTIISDFLNFS